MPKCPNCRSSKTNKNRFGFECLKCGYINNKEFLNEKIKKGEIKVEFIKKPEKIKVKVEKETNPDWIKKIKEDLNKAEEDWEKIYHDPGETTEKDLRNLIGRLVTKFKHIREYVNNFEDLGK